MTPEEDVRLTNIGRSKLGKKGEKRYPELPKYMQHLTSREVGRYLTLSERGQKWARFQHVKKDRKILVAINLRLHKESEKVEKGT